MLPGFNTNVRHGGVLFHVQTEDSGKAHPHVITHLYHGGTILASEKSSYAEHVDSPDCATRVRELMDGQHHAMLKRLGTGDLDEQIEQRLGPDVFSRDEKSKTAGTTRGSTEPERTLRPAPRTTPPPVAAAPPPASSPATGAPASEAGPRESHDRPLDELILDYLVEAARRRKRRAE